MGMKKSTKGKGKSKKKSGGKSKRKDNWTFDGGQVNEMNQSAFQTNRRHTQDRDERIRRGKLKVSERREQKNVTMKLAERVHFTEPEQKFEIPVVKKQKREPPPKSNRSVLERLQNFVNASLERRATSNDEDSSSTQSSNADDDDGDDSSIDSALDDKSESVEAEPEPSHDVSDGESEQGGDLDDSASADDMSSNDFCHEWYFSFGGDGGDGGERSTVPQGLKLLQPTSLGLLFGVLKAERFVKPVKALADVSALPKLWRSRGHERIPDTFGQQLLPYFTCFVDAFVEGRSHVNDGALMRAALLHVCVHAVRTRSRVLKNNYKLRKRTEALTIAAASSTSRDAALSGPTTRRSQRKGAPPAPAASTSKAKSKASSNVVGDPRGAAEARLLDDDDEVDGGGAHAICDQGFCRPRVLVLCPFRQVAKQCVDAIRTFLGDNTTVSNAAKFEEEFGGEDDVNDDDDGDEDNDGDDSGPSGRKKPKKGLRKVKKSLPDDFRATFRGNIDDDFKIGMQVNPGQGRGAGVDKGVYLRLYSDFYQSDIIVASPLGLRLAIEQQAQGPSAGGNLNFDFLSSIEIVLLHQADVMYMQNWDHVEFCLNHTNRMPLSNHDTDFSRVRPYFLNARAAQHRQLIVTSHFVEPEMNATFRAHAQSCAGNIFLRASHPQQEQSSEQELVAGTKKGKSHVPLSQQQSQQQSQGYIAQVLCGVEQVFARVPCGSFAAAADVRFMYLCESVLTPLLRLEQKRTLIVAPSYIDYVRIRNELMRREVNAAYICEYSRESETSRGRSRFFHGLHDVLLYSGRAHFFRRFHLRGAMNLIFYSVPEYPHFYPEIVNMLSEAAAGGLGAEMSCITLFTQFDKMALERVVGPKRCKHMLESDKATFMFK